MDRNTFIQIIRLRSFWKIDKRKGNYTLPSGDKLSYYIEHLVRSQMEIDKLGIRSDGNLTHCTGGEVNLTTCTIEDYHMLNPYIEDEICTFDEMENRIQRLVKEIIG